jgi:hypothetical protein
MKKITVLLFALIAGAFAMQLSAAPSKGPARSEIYYGDQGFTQLGSTSIFYDISQRTAAGPGDRYGISILGQVKNTSIWTSWLYPYRYYSSTYESNGPGAGFIAAFQVNGGTADYLDASNGTTIDNVRMTARLEPQGDVAARVVYTLQNTNNEAVTVNAGVWGDIMIGNNDKAPLESMNNTYNGDTYGIKMKHDDEDNTIFLCALFGDHVTGVTAADDYWFGFFSSNWHANEICGEYSKTIYDTNTSWGQSYAQYWMVENSDYDCGLGFCWTGREIPAGESIELSFVISVGEVDFMEPFDPDPDPEDPESIFTYNIQAFDCEGWNDFTALHPVKVWGEYVHAYGQNGYLEYQVDDENTWHVIDELISGAEDGYEFEFNVTYNPNRYTDHVVAVRYNDGLGNTIPLEGLSWIDIRSTNVTATCQDDPVYNGQPHLFDVTIDGETITIGQNGEFVTPRTYNYTALVGEFEEGTIGENIVQLTIDKAPCVIDVLVPDDVVYDALPHGATAIVPEGSGVVTITYEVMGTREILTTAPIEIGVYKVWVEVAEGDYYYGMPSTDYGQFAIFADPTSVKELAVDKNDNVWYTIQGIRVAAPTAPGIYIYNGKKYIFK